MEKSALIQTKLMPPRNGSKLVKRSHLQRKLSQGLRCKLTLVSAPAGYGKTTLISTWLQAIARPVAWVSLDANDNDLILFFQYLVTAIRGVFPAACADTLQLTQLDQLPRSSFLLAQFINDIAAIDDDFILALDDFHLIHETAVLNLIAELVEKQPPNLHLVILTRKDPPLPLPRLRARNDMSEIRQRDLRFRPEEAGVFLQQTLDIQTETATAVALNEYTEGWPVGLQLVGLSLRESKDPAVLLDNLRGKPNTFANKYLVSEVLAQQPVEIRTFILQCAILDRICDPLCQAVTHISVDKEVNLERIETANLFLVALDNRGEWYRFHHLFQDALARQLHEEYTKNQINTLHLRASQWFADHGYIDEAIQHALNADDMEAAVAILEANDQDLLNGLDRHTLERWLSRLPEEIIWQRPRLLVVKAWLFFREYRLSALDATLDAAEVATAAQETPEATRHLQGEISTLRAISLVHQRQDYPRALALAADALQWLPDSQLGPRGLALMAWALAQHALGHKSEAVQALQTAIRHPSPVGPAKVQAFIGLCLLWEKEGELQRMAQINEQFLALAAQGSNPNAVIGANLFAGRLQYEWNNLEQADRHFSLAYDQRIRANFIGSFDGAIGLARIYLAQGDADKAQCIIDKLRAYTIGLGNIGLLLPLDAFQAYLWLTKGNASSALRWARALDGDPDVSIFIAPTAALAHIHILITAGNLTEVKVACEMLQAKLLQAQANQSTTRSIQINIHLALAFQRLGKPEAALDTLEQALILAQPGGFLRSFVDVGSGLRPLLEQLQAQAIVPDYLPQVLAAFPTTDPSVPKSSQAAATVLTPRELEILRLMDVGLTNQEIAIKLVISPHTVKRHASNIYSKLNVNGRFAAIYRAKELKIL